MVMNYFRCKQFSPIFVYFAYIDVPDYYADNLFAKHGVKVDFGDEYAHSEHKYRVIFCRCWRWQEKRFIAAMSELPYIMALNGYGDYGDFCANFMKEFVKET